MKTKDFAIVGYSYNMSSYCTKCVVDALKNDGLVFRGAVVSNIEHTLDKLSEYHDIDRKDVWDYDNADMPKPIYTCDAEYDLDICEMCDRIISG